MRAHLFQTLCDQEGNVLHNALVRVFEASTYDVSGNLVQGDEIVASMWDGPDPAHSALMTNPLMVDSGVVDLWLDAPQYVRLGVTPENVTGEYSIEGVPVLAPAAPGGGGAASPVVYGQYNLTTYSSALVYDTGEVISFEYGAGNFGRGLDKTWANFEESMEVPSPVTEPMPDWMRIVRPSNWEYLQMAEGWWSYQMGVSLTWATDPGYVEYYVDTDWSGAGGGYVCVPAAPYNGQWKTTFSLTSPPLYTDGSYRFMAGLSWGSSADPTGGWLEYNFLRLSPLAAVPVYVD